MPEQKISYDLCEGAGICEAVCPMKVYEMQDVDGVLKAVPVRSEDCVACRVCEVQCPNGAIEIID